MRDPVPMSGSLELALPITCPACGQVQEMAAQFDAPSDTPKVPEAGDVSICFGCSAINVFETPTKLAPAPQDLADEVLRVPTVRRALALRQQQREGRLGR